MMKRAILLSLALWLCCQLGAAASIFPTFVDGPGYAQMPSLDAYQAMDSLRLDAQTPMDLAVDREASRLYVADGAGGQVLCLDTEGRQLGVYGQGILKAPEGVFVAGGLLYVADSGQAKVLVFHLADGALALSITRPQVASFGKSTGFLPRKIAADSRGNIYVVSDNSPNGVMQFNPQGQFSGFTGANAAQLGWVTTLQRLLYTEAQKAQLLQVLPPTPTNLEISAEGLLYTATNGTRPGIKKFSTAGIALMSPQIRSSAIVDFVLDAIGNVYAVDAQGNIHITDAQGNRVFRFATMAPGRDVRGASRNPVAIGLGQDHTLYVLDRQHASILRYVPTDFGAQVLSALSTYSQGLYLQGEEAWRAIWQRNSSFLLAHRALAQASLKRGEVHQALSEFRLGEDEQGYSEAFWHVRSQWIAEHSLQVVLALAGLMLVRFVYKKWRGKAGKKELIKSGGLIAQLRFARFFAFHPIDSVYDIKTYRRGDVPGAMAWFILFLLSQVLTAWLTAYLFGGEGEERFRLVGLLFGAAWPFLLATVCSYLVSAISDGEASLRQVFVVVCYSLVPCTLLLPLAALLSRILTLNEGFLYDLIRLAAFVWTALLLLVGLKEAYAYRVRELVKNLLLTAFSMASAITALGVVAMLLTQEVSFLQRLVSEVMTRASR